MMSRGDQTSCAAVQFLLLSISIPWNNIDALLMIKNTHSLRMVRGWWLKRLQWVVGTFFFPVSYLIFFFFFWAGFPWGNAHCLESYAPNR